MTWQEFKDEVDRQIAELPDEYQNLEIWYIDVNDGTAITPPAVIVQHGAIVIH